jgi:hypothetical protein
MDRLAASAANPSLSALWSRARADYIGGATATEACRRYGLSKSRFFERARAEGWRRKDEGADAGEAEDDGFDPTAPLAPARVLADLAWRRAERALASGDLRAAQGWTGLALNLRRTADAEERLAAWRRTDAALRAKFEGPADASPPPSQAPERPDSPDYSTGADSAEPLCDLDEEAEAIDDAIARLPLTPDERAEWRAWAKLSEQMRRARPDQPCWGETVEVDEVLDALGPPAPEDGTA